MHGQRMKHREMKDQSLQTIDSRTDTGLIQETDSNLREHKGAAPTAPLVPRALPDDVQGHQARRVHRRLTDNLRHHSGHDLHLVAGVFLRKCWLFITSP